MEMEKFAKLKECENRFIERATEIENEIANLRNQWSMELRKEIIKAKQRMAKLRQ